MCALLALHLIAEGRDGDGCHAPSLGDEWKIGYPKSQMWESEGKAWSEDESVSSVGSREGNEGNDALHVIRLYGPGDKISLFLLDSELAKVALSCRMALDVLCQEMHEACQPGEACGHGMSLVLSPWAVCDNKGEGCGERMKEKEM